MLHGHGHGSIPYNPSKLHLPVSWPLAAGTRGRNTGLQRFGRRAAAEKGLAPLANMNFEHPKAHLLLDDAVAHPLRPLVQLCRKIVWRFGRVDESLHDFYRYRQVNAIAGCPNRAQLANQVVAAETREGTQKEWVWSVERATHITGGGRLKERTHRLTPRPWLSGDGCGSRNSSRRSRVSSAPRIPFSTSVSDFVRSAIYLREYADASLAPPVLRALLPPPPKRRRGLTKRWSEVSARGGQTSRV